MRQYGIRKILPFVVMILLAAGCWNPFQPKEKGPGKGEEYLPRTSPENVLHNFVLAYKRKDYVQYQPLFHQEYKFHFAQVDIDRDPTIPQEWGLSQELASAEGMFADPLVSINLSLSVTNVDSLVDGRVKIFVSATQLTFDIRDQVTYSVTDPQDFYFIMDPADSTLWLLH